MVDTRLDKAKDLVLKADGLLKADKEKRKRFEELDSKIAVIGLKITDAELELDICDRAANLLSNVADEKIDAVLKKVTGVINKALTVLFPDDARVVVIEKTMHKNVYPHFVVILMTGDGEKRSFVQSGSGLAQVVSFLFTVCLIDLIGGRKILVIDELLNGLHPRAKRKIADILKAMENDFQFILTEYQLDVGKQFEVIKENGTARVALYEGGDYYLTVANEVKEEAV